MEWVLFDEGTAEIDGENLHKYVFAYSNGSEMTKLPSGASVSGVFSSVSVMPDLSETDYQSLHDYPFHVIARSVVASADEGGDINSCWAMVPKDY